MTIEQIAKRAEKSQMLKSYKLKDGTFLVESTDGKILYPVSINGTVSCTCADFQRNIKTDSAFRCKHILAAMDCKDSADTVDAAERKRPKLNPEFIKNLQGRDFVLFAGLLDLAHQKGLIKLEVEILQYPTPENGMEAVCRSTAEFKHGERFSDIGDASIKNTNKIIASCLLRMASTRAKARALRDATNVTIVCLEELGDLDDVIGADNSKGAKVSKPGKKEVIPAEKETPKEIPVKTPATPKPKAEPVKTGAKDQPNNAVPKVSEAQARAIFNVGRRRGITQQELDDMSKKDFGVAVSDMTSLQASQFLRRIQTAA